MCKSYLLLPKKHTRKNLWNMKAQWHQKMCCYVAIASSCNRTPGSYCNSLVAQAKYYCSFQLTHMSREDHAQSIESAMAGTHNFVSMGNLGTFKSVNDSDHDCVVRM